MPQRLRPIHVGLALSLCLHLLPLVWPGRTAAPVPPTAPPPLQARLQTPPAELPELAWTAPTDAPAAASPPVAASRPAPAKEKRAIFTVDREKTPKTWVQAVEQQFSRQQESGLFYPEAAIAQGLQGEALVLLILSPTGDVVAARIEESSGHGLLDDAALRAVRRLRGLPADAPGEALLPVRFRLR